MNLDKKVAVSLVWLAAVLAAGFLASVGSVMGWLLMTVLAFGPPLILQHFGRELSPTTSQRIQQAKR